MTEMERLRRDCSEAYQAVGVLAYALGYNSNDGRISKIDHDTITKLLDNLSAAAEGEPRPHNDLLPFELECAGSVPR